MFFLQHIFLKILLKFPSFKCFITKSQERIDNEEYKKKKIIGALCCAPSIPPSLLQSVITWISQHIGDQDLVLLKQLWVKI